MTSKAHIKLQGQTSSQHVLQSHMPIRITTVAFTFYAVLSNLIESKARRHVM